MNPQEKNKFGEIFPHMENILHCGLYVYDPLTSETHWSPGIYHILGLQPNSIESTFENFAKYVLAEDKERVIAAVKKSRETKTPYHLEFSILDAKGIYKRIYAENKFSDDKEPYRYDGIIKDITENYFYKKALEQKVAQLDKSNQSLQEFVYIASHDLQEPLRKISTFVGRLKSRFDALLGQEGSMYVERILNSTNNMQTLLEDLLNFSRLSFTDKELENVSLNDCVKSVLNDLEIKIEDTKAQIKCAALPNVQGHYSQLKQLFNNLVSNAIKFRKPGVAPVINITAEEVNGTFKDLPLQKETNYIKISVEDNGIGFEQEFSEKIFMIFQRLNGRSEYAGSGVGLSICKRIAENHQGFIYANGEPGIGATLTVLLPLKRA